MKASMAQLNEMFNSSSGFNLWQNETSVREYFRVQTNNKVDLTNEIISVDLAQNSSYYLADNAPGDLVSDVINAISVKYPGGFSNLSYHPLDNTKLCNFSLICQGEFGKGVAWGIDKQIINNGIPMPVKNVSLCSWTQDYQYDVNVICHEYGHSIWSWTDFYNTAASNTGRFCLMGCGGTRKAPVPIITQLLEYNVDG